MQHDDINNLLNILQQDINTVENNQNDYGLPYPRGPSFCCCGSECNQIISIGSCWEQAKCLDGAPGDWICTKRGKDGRCEIDRNCTPGDQRCKVYRINAQIIVPQCNTSYVKKINYFDPGCDDKVDCVHGKPSVSRGYNNILNLAQILTPEEQKNCCEKRSYPVIYRSAKGNPINPMGGGSFTDNRKHIDPYTGWTAVQWAMYQSGGYWDTVFFDSSVGDNVYVVSTLVKDPNFRCPTDPMERALWCQYSPGAQDSAGRSVCCKRTTGCKDVSCAINFCPPDCFTFESSIVNPDGTFKCDNNINPPQTPTQTLTPTITLKKEYYLEWKEKAAKCSSKRLDRNGNCLVLLRGEKAVLDQIIKTIAISNGKETLIDFITYKKEKTSVCPDIFSNRPDCDSAYVADWGPMTSPTCCVPIWKCATKGKIKPSHSKRVQYCFNLINNLTSPNNFISPVSTPKPSSPVSTPTPNLTLKEKSYFNWKMWGYFYKLEVTSKVWENKFQSVHSFIDLGLSGLKEEEVYYDEKKKIAYIMYPSRTKTYYIKSGVSISPNLELNHQKETWRYISSGLFGMYPTVTKPRVRPPINDQPCAINGTCRPPVVRNDPLGEPGYPEDWPGEHKISIDKTTKNVFVSNCIEIEIRDSEITNLWSREESVGIINIKANVRKELVFKNMNPSTGFFNIDLLGKLTGRPPAQNSSPSLKSSANIFGLENLNILSLKLNKIRLNYVTLKKAPQELGLWAVEGFLTISPDKPSLINLLYTTSYEDNSLTWPFNQSQKHTDWPAIVSSNLEYGFTLQINNNSCLQYNLIEGVAWKSHLHLPSIGIYHLNNAETNKNILKGINNTINLMPGANPIVHPILSVVPSKDLIITLNRKPPLHDSSIMPNRTNDLIDFIDKKAFGSLNLVYREYPLFIMEELFLISEHSFSVNKTSEISKILTNLKQKLNASVMLGPYNLTNINDHIIPPPPPPPPPLPPPLPPITPTFTNATTIVQNNVLCANFASGSLSGIPVGILDLNNDSLWAHRKGLGTSAESSRPDFYDTIYVFEASSTGFISTLSFVHGWQEQIPQRYGLATLQVYAGNGINGPLLFQSRIIIHPGEGWPHQTWPTLDKNIDKRYVNYNVSIPCVAKNKYSVRLNYESAKNIATPLNISGWIDRDHSKFFEYYTYSRILQTYTKINFTPDFRVYISKDPSLIGLCKEPIFISKDSFVGTGVVSNSSSPALGGSPLIIPPKNPVIPPPKNPSCYPTGYDTAACNQRVPVSYYPEGCIDKDLPNIIGLIRCSNDKREYPIVSPYSNYAAVFKKHPKIYIPQVYPTHVSLDPLSTPI